MVNIRSANEIILSLIDFFKTAQPDANLNPGSVFRDLLEGPGSQLAILYDQLSSVSNKQSLRLVVGSDLDKLAKNFKQVRKSASPASGVALMTFASINANININKGDIVVANNGFTFQVANGTTVSATSSNFYRSIASKYSEQLSFVGISDQYAVEVTVIATTFGTAGNIPSYSLNRVATSGVSHVTNISAFKGGTDQESDASFRNRILSSFSGSSVGTTLGYLNTALSVTGVSDATVVEPGDPLMVRDGSVVSTASDGTKTIVSEGSGGKVDIIALGNILTENIESYIFIDKSNNNDPTNSKNDVVLGQILADADKTINKKRIDNIKSGQLPCQPVEEILSISGSLSGNFVEKTVDSLGRVSGNYELVKDTGVYAGSAWGFDKLHWVSDRISLFSEDKIKGQLNGQDTTTFSDVERIPSITQSVPIINENSSKTSDRSFIKLLHTPVSSVTRVVNVNTGERYLISDQNPDKTGTYNTTGRIKISGNTLPTSSDTLQVDYNWIVDYDSTMDYDGLEGTNNQRSVVDSIDWGYSSMVNNELITFTKTDDYYVGAAQHPIASVTSVNSFTEVRGVVSTVNSGLYINKKAVVISNLLSEVSTVDFIKLQNTNIELYTTAQSDGSFTNLAGVVGIDIVYTATIILPTDTVAVDGDVVSVLCNFTDVFNTTGGSSNGTQITIPASSISSTDTSIVLSANYVALITDLTSTSIVSIPMSRSGNGFTLSNNNGFNNFSITNTSKRENVIVQKNLSNQFYIDLSILANDYTIATSNVLVILRLSDGKELWNNDNVGSIITGNSGNYQLVLSEYNSPVIGDRAIVIYYAYDNRKFQPFSFDNKIVKTQISQLSTDPGTSKLFIPLSDISAQASALEFEIIEPNTDTVLFSALDGYMTVSGVNGLLSSPSLSFFTDIVNKKVKISNATNPNNNGLYEIVSYNSSTNVLTITNTFDYISNDQVCIVRLLDGKEVWDYSGVISISDNKLLLSSSALASDGDFVYAFIYNFHNLKKAATRVVTNTADQTINSGILTVSGTVLYKAKDIIFTATNNGLRLNLAEAIRKDLGLSSISSIPSTIKLAKIVKLEKVVTAGSNNDEVLEILTTYDVFNSELQNNLLFSDEMISDPDLNAFDFRLPATSTNTLNTDTVNLPKIGDKLRVTFYYSITDTENLSFTKNGTLYTNKKFALIDRVYVASGFKSSLSTRLTLTSFTQPVIGSRYKMYYDYLAPKQNERISITSNYNKIISDVTFAVEESRPVNADVLVKAAKLVLLDITMNIVVSNDYLSTSSTIVQNVKDQIISTMSIIELGQTIDTPTLVNAAQSVQGVSRARVVSFNKKDTTAQILTFTAQGDEYFAPNEVTVNTETR